LIREFNDISSRVIQRGQQADTGANTCRNAATLYYEDFSIALIGVLYARYHAGMYFEKAFQQTKDVIQAFGKTINMKTRISKLKLREKRKMWNSGRNSLNAGRHCIMIYMITLNF
jgi:hypothetical protein